MAYQSEAALEQQFIEQLNKQEYRPQVTVLRSVRSSAFRASMSRGSIKNYYIISLKTPTAINN